MQAVRKLLFEELAKKRLDEVNVLREPRIPLIGILDNVRSLYNVGSCFRTADALMIEQLVLTGWTGYPPRKEISKTALDAERSVPWSHHRDPATAIGPLKERGYRIVALELTDQSRSLEEVAEDLRSRPTAFVVGNELSGIDEDVLSLCDEAALIPMGGVKHSLNVAVAFGMAAYEFSRGRARTLLPSDPASLEDRSDPHPAE